MMTMICIINCGTTWLEEIKKNLTELNCLYSVIDLDKIKGIDFQSFSGVVVSGAPILLTKVDLKNYIKTFTFIKNVNNPILGICLGHQVIGLLYGSEINKLDKTINKKEHIEIVKKDALFSDVENRPLFQEEHSEYITLPAGFILLAKSNSCENEAMKHKKKNIYGVQFHPEVSGKNGRTILKNFVDICHH